MGSRRRDEGAPGPPRFNLRGEAQAFANELSDLLNHTVANGIRLTAITDKDGLQARIARGIKRDDPAAVQTIPLRRGNAGIYLGLLYRMAADDAGQYPMIRSSVMYLSADSAGEQVLLHYDYERDKGDDYPEAHLQICATSVAWDEVSARYGGRGRALEKLHLPVGGRRFRPTVEDLIEFLVVEKLVSGHRGWQDHIQASRQRFEERQLRAAVRRNPEVAKQVLRDEGHLRT